MWCSKCVRMISMYWLGAFNQFIYYFCGKCGSSVLGLVVVMGILLAILSLMFAYICVMVVMVGL